MEQSAQQPAKQSVPQTSAGAVTSNVKSQAKNLKSLIILAVVAALFIAISIIGYLTFTQSPERVVSSFVKASQTRKAVAKDQFFDRQAEQSFSIVYKIPPKSFKVQKTTIEDKTALVELEWTTIDSSRDYKERTDTVVFALRRDGRSWKLDRVQQGDIVNYDFLFGN